MNQHKRGQTAARVGKMAELVVEDIFGLTEPTVEIKACARQYYRVIVRAEQLEGECLEHNITYCIVLYERPRKKIDGKLHYTGSPEEAFAGKLPLQFLFISAHELHGIVKSGNLVPKRVKHQAYYHIKVMDIKKALGDNPSDVWRDVFTGQQVTVYGSVPKAAENVPF